MNTFLRPLEYYTRDIDAVAGYMQQTALYLNKMTGKPIRTCTDWLQKEFGPGGRFEFKAPIANITVRDPQSGDRRPAQCDLKLLFDKIIENDLITSPSLTVYLPPHVKRSLLSQFIDINIKKRGVVKEEMFAAEAAGDELLASNKKNEQTSLKTRNNALSGAHSSKYTILYNKSTHSSLTSTCRSATSYGNANNEKLLAGSRHYWMPGIVTNNILAILAITDWEEFQSCMDTYELHYPSVEETMEVIHYSADLFWRNRKAMDRIQRLVEALEPIERAAFVYIGDLYHVRKFNSDMMRGFVGGFFKERTKLKGTVDSVLDRIDADTVALVSLLRVDLIGEIRSFWDVKKKAPEKFEQLLASAEQVYDHAHEYHLFINAIMNTKNTPLSIARLPDTIRRVGLVSDTDSTMATVQRWAEWYCDGEMTGKLADDVSDTMIYVATQNIAHMLAIMSANMGVERDNIHRYSMKNEFKFSSFSLTNKAKHYFSVITSQEGVLKEEPELEVKGVALRTSNIPPVIMNEFRDTIRNMAMTVADGKKLKMMPIVKRLADIERDIVRSVKDGEYLYLKTGQIKNKEAYTTPESSAFFYHGFWEDTFAAKYGSAGEPTYGVVKIAVNLDNKTQIRRWLDGMEDVAMRTRLEEWFKRHPKKTFIQFLLPEHICSTRGIPQEILDAADFRRIIFSSVEPYYHVLETIGLYAIDKNRTKLVSDYY